MSKQTDPLILFHPKLPKLSKNEEEVLKLLVEAARMIAPIYLEQENRMKERGNFYPKDVNRQEVEKAAKKDPSILSHFTIVEKINGKLVAIPYHIKYADALKPIAEKLNQASKMCKNKAFSSFLKLQAKALMDGSYEKATAFRLKIKPYILDISIGPLEHFDDRVFYAKAAYQSWVGVLDIEGSKKLEDSRDMIFRSQRESLIPGKRVINKNEVKTRVLHVILFAGLIARTRFVGLNLPMNLEWVERYGSEVVLFEEANDVRLEEQILPTFKKIFSTAFTKEFSSEDLRKGSMSYVGLHELAHNYLYYKDSEKNLQDLLESIYELSATVLGMRIAGSLLLKDIISNKQLESMIVAFICRSFDLAEKSRKDKFMVNYALGGIIFINYMLESGALKQKQGMTMPSFMRIFVSLHELSYMLERLLAVGTRKDAENFINKYGVLIKF